ncbi:MAG: hypothetical protein COW65_03050 [Cytophagales bacterium CG18_big_fil_WC_8_21_14_2_50_42_9]|nr:MAG: hypothetical protein COW65_03050 [Cytophagales bacterium CG18_big_fil_WC_8_21_14_2_50_42_9]
MAQRAKFFAIDEVITANYIAITELLARGNTIAIRLRDFHFSSSFFTRSNTLSGHPEPGKGSYAYRLSG